ncbi:MAG: putative ABC transporter permease [Christensenellaceae bacterium]|nr:putative ABC transporter permease [Christensenellaceae bacterium]
MSLFLILAYLFFIGSCFGWLLELFFRRFFSSVNPERKWINPGFCTGPYLPLYGSGLCILYLIASLEDKGLLANPVLNRAGLFLAMAVCMTVIEYIAGAVSLYVFKVRLWDYRGEWANLQGIICPKFSLFWALLGGLYYFAVHPFILDALAWLSKNLAFSFVIGYFFGVFTIDVCHSAQIITRMRRFARENSVVLRYEAIKEHIRAVHARNAQKYHFFKPFHTELGLTEHLRELLETFEKRVKS